MAKTPATLAKPAAPIETKAKSRSQGRVRPDLATLTGLGLAMTGIIGGLLLEKGSIQDVAQGTALMIVLGGTLGAVLVTTPMATVVRAFKGLKEVFVERPNDVAETIDSLIQYAAKARKYGIVSLEIETAAITDPFLRKALELAVDGMDKQEVRKMMEIDIALSEQAAESEAKVWESAGGYAPTIGIIGAVMGLIQVMKHLEDIKEVGHGIAVAFVATVYGVSAANILLLPAASKLKARMREASLRKDMILEGIVGIVEGLNPMLIRMKLDPYQGPAATTKKTKPAKSADAIGSGGTLNRGTPVPAPAKT